MKKDIINIDLAELQAMKPQQDLQTVRKKLEEMLPPEMQSQVEKMLHGVATKDDMVRETDDLATATLSLAVRGMIDLLNQTKPKVDGLEEGIPAHNLDPNQVRALAGFNYSYTQAFKALSDFVSKRQKTQEQYSPHIMMGGKRYPIELKENSYLIIDGELHLRRTHNYWLSRNAKELQNQRAEMTKNSKVGNKAYGICCVNPDNPGKCFHEDQAEQKRKKDAKENKDPLAPDSGGGITAHEPIIDET